MNLLPPPPPEVVKSNLRADLLKFARRIVNAVVPGQKYPAINYRMWEPVVRAAGDTAAADILKRLQENRLRELGMLEELATHFKTRMDGK